MDWQQLIDEAVDRRLDEYALPDPDLGARVAAGRAALRRRRTAVASLTCAAVVVLSGAAWALPSGTGRSAEPGPATPVPTATPSSSASSSAMAAPVTPARLDAETGELVLEDGWHVVHRIEDPFPRLADGRRPAASLAVDVRRGDEHRWVVMYWEPGDGSTSVSAAPGEGGVPDFFYWVDLQVAITTGEWSTAVAGRATDGLAPGAGVTILDQWRAPELGSLVRVAEAVVAGYQRWLVARPGPTGGMEAKVVSFQPGADPDAFVSYVRDEHLLEAHR
jgi:hypothetical protein